jgi:hypothetical protein
MQGDYDLADVAAGCHALWQASRRWGLRFYAGAFISIGFLFLARAVRHHDTLRVIAKAFAGTVGATAVAFGVISYSYALRQRRTARRAGLNPRTTR